MEPNASQNSPPLAVDKWAAELIVIGASTGGPRAVQTVLQSAAASSLPADSGVRDVSQHCSDDSPSARGSLYVPIVIAQHMPKGFTFQLAKRLNEACPFPVVESTHGTRLEPNKVYVCPAGCLTRVARNDSGAVFLQVEQAEGEEWFYRPSLDVLLKSAADTDLRVLAVVLTGMGEDGLLGARFVKDRGGRVITESEQSAVIYGMPKAVYQAGLSDKHVSLSEIGPWIRRLQG